MPERYSYPAVPTSLPPSGTAGGDLTGTYPNPGVAKINGTALGTLSGAATGASLVWNGSAWVPGVPGLVFAVVLSADTATLDTGANVIPAGFNLLEMLAYVRTDETAVASTIGMRFNGDSNANYDRSVVANSNTTVSGSSTAGANMVQATVAAGSEVANVFTPMQFEIPAYAGTVGFKSGVFATGVPSSTVANARAVTGTFEWRSAGTAINQATLVITSGSGQKFKAGSALYVYVH